MVKENVGGLQFVEAPEITPHTPPAPTVDFSTCKTFWDMLGDSFVGMLLTEEWFYFTFGLQLNNLGHITNSLQELCPKELGDMMREKGKVTLMGSLTTYT